MNSTIISLDSNCEPIFCSVELKMLQLHEGSSRVSCSSPSHKTSFHRKRNKEVTAASHCFVCEGGVVCVADNDSALKFIYSIVWCARTSTLHRCSVLYSDAFEPVLGLNLRFWTSVIVSLQTANLVGFVVGPAGMKVLASQMLSRKSMFSQLLCNQISSDFLWFLLVSWSFQFFWPYSLVLFVVPTYASV